MVSNQYANKNCAAARTSQNAVHPYVVESFPPRERVTSPSPSKTKAATARTPAQARGWQYSHGERARRMPDRGGYAHHPRRPSEGVWPTGAFISGASLSLGFPVSPAT